jgi:hypothetical protein
VAKTKKRRAPKPILPSERGCTAFVWNDRSIVFRYFPTWSVDKASDSNILWLLRRKMHGTVEQTEADPRWQIVAGRLLLEEE